MEAIDVHTKMIDSYLTFFKNMSAQNKIDLISKLTNSLNRDVKQNKLDFFHSYGGWDNSESAEDLINVIKGSRNFKRIVDEL